MSSVLPAVALELLLASITCGPLREHRVAPSPPPRYAAVLDTINAKYAAYKGMRTELLNTVYPLPVSITGDSGWVTTYAGATGRDEVLVIRLDGGWTRADRMRRVRYRQ
jgi:hypothetical protein